MFSTSTGAILNNGIKKAGADRGIDPLCFREAWAKKEESLSLIEKSDSL